MIRKFFLRIWINIILSILSQANNFDYKIVITLNRQQRLSKHLRIATIKPAYPDRCYRSDISCDWCGCSYNECSVGKDITGRSFTSQAVGTLQHSRHFSLIIAVLHGKGKYSLKILLNVKPSHNKSTIKAQSAEEENMVDGFLTLIQLPVLKK